MRKFLAGLAAAIFAFTPVLASAQTIGSSPNTLPLAGSCGTVAVSTPCLNLTQTWNAGGVTFTGLFANFTDTASASGSLPIQIQVNNATIFSVDKFGTGNFASRVNLTTDAGLLRFGSSADVVLQRDAANTLALRNGVNGQTFNVYNTYTDASNYERLAVIWASSTVKLQTEQAGIGVARALEFGSVGNNYVGLKTNDNLRWFVGGSTGHWLAQIDNTYDIGANGANRPRDVYAAGSVRVQGTNGFFSVPSSGTIRTPGTTVSGLQSAATVGVGARSWVTDATQTFTSANFGVTVTGGGANGVPVISDGTNWKIGG